MIPPRMFYFIRHGQTDHNLHNILQGQLDIPLNAKGIDQAQNINDFIQRLNISKIFASPLKRARYTAEIINKNSKLDIEYLNELKERGWGVWEGRNKSELPVKSHLFQLDDNELPEGAESFDIFLNRTKQGLNHILRASTTPLIVSHAGIFKALCYILSKKDLATDNCQLYEFKPLIQKSWSIEQIE